MWKQPAWRHVTPLVHSALDGFSGAVSSNGRRLAALRRQWPAAASDLFGDETMTFSPPPEPLELDLVGLEQAFLRASWNAQRIAAQTGTKLAFWRDGKVALIDPDSITLPMPAELPPRGKIMKSERWPGRPGPSASAGTRPDRPRFSCNGVDRRLEARQVDVRVPFMYAGDWMCFATISIAARQF
jgi:hypothetical protein